MWPQSQWLCTIEHHEKTQWVRLGFNYIKGFREDTARAIAAEREHAPFSSIRDLVRRVPGLHKDAMNRLAEVGALNSSLRKVPNTAAKPCGNLNWRCVP